jgi:uncharacterized membrane protein YeaQ/YmgE (transglycosylase-associated protein family)
MSENAEQLGFAGVRACRQRLRMTRHVKCNVRGHRSCSLQEDMKMGLLGFLLFGLIVGLLARAIMPGRQSMGLLMTMLLGVVGSFVGGLVGNLLFRGGGTWDHPSTAGWIGSILGSLVLLALLGRTRRRRGVLG